MFVCRYSLILEKDKEMKYVPFKNSDGMTDKATLEQIDYVTSQFKNQEEFLMHLRNSGILTEAPDKVYIGYKQDKEIKKKDIIYDSSIIRFASLSSLRHKKQGVRNALIDQNQDIINLIKRVKSYAISEKSFKSIKSSKLFPFHVREALEEYIEMCNKNYKSPTEQFDLKEINDTITYRILKDYSEFRKLILWERKYLKKLEEQKEAQPDEYVQMNLVDYFEKKSTNPESVEKFEEYAESELGEKINYQVSLDTDLGTEDMIENSRLKECYLEYDGDIERVLEVLGQDFLDSVSELDQDRCGYTNYKQRRR